MVHCLNLAGNGVFFVYVQIESLILFRSITCCLYFRIRPDYIFILFRIPTASDHLTLLPYGIVVGAYSILEYDCLLMIFDIAETLVPNCVANAVALKLADLVT